ncbi:TPA: hypothetical protein N0F65_005890, partial [Lagenidium giganteum]
EGAARRDGTPCGGFKCSGVVTERKLLHWVNAIPLTACLLVEDLRELRFGDVLAQITRWIQSDARADPTTSTLAYTSAKDAVQAAVQFAAKQSQSEDGDVLYIVNEGRCAQRVLDGDVDAIVAVVHVLKRVSDALAPPDCVSHQPTHAALTIALGSSLDVPEQSPPTARATSAGQRRRERLNLEITRSDGEQSPPELKPPSKWVRRQHVGRVSQRRVNQVDDAANRQGIYPSFCAEEMGGLRVYGMLDPKPKPGRVASANAQPSHATAVRTCSRSARRAPCSGPKAPDVASPNRAVESVDLRPSSAQRLPDPDTAIAWQVCQWMASLGIAVDQTQFFQHNWTQQTVSFKDAPPRTRLRATSVKPFADGVLLCRIAAAIAHRHGGISARNRLRPCPEAGGGLGIQGCVVAPVSPAQKRHNLSLAVAVLKEFQAFQLQPYAGDASLLWNLFAMDAQENDDEVDEERQRKQSSSVWRVLSHIRERARHLDRGKRASRGAAQAWSSICAGPSSPSASANAPRSQRCPHVTAQQMRTVDDWLKEFRANPNVSGTTVGVLQDTLRNGVTL